MSIRQPDAEVPRAAPRPNRLDAVLQVGVHTRPSTTTPALRLDAPEETDGFFDGTKMRLQATRFVDAGVMVMKTKKEDVRMLAWREAEMLSSWKSLLEMAKKRRQIDEVTDEMLSAAFATQVFEMHFEFQDRRQYQTASSILKSLGMGNPMKLVAKDDAKHAMGQTLMKKYSSGDMGAEMGSLHELVFLHGHEDDFFERHEVELTDGIMGTMKMGYYAMQFLNKGMDSFKNPNKTSTRAKAEDAYNKLKAKMEKRGIPAGWSFEKAMSVLKQQWQKHMPNKRKTAWAFYQAMQGSGGGSSSMTDMDDMDDVGSY